MAEKHHCRQCMGSCELIGTAYKRGLTNALRIVRETSLDRVDKSNKELIIEALESFISGKPVSVCGKECSEEELGYPNFSNGGIPLG